MPGIRDRKIEYTELVQGDDRIIRQKEVIQETSEDGCSTTEVEVNRYPAHWCGHYDVYGFSCYCGNRFCKSCLNAGRIWYCQKCGRTVAACHFEKRYDGVFCPDCRPAIDWNGPLGAMIKAFGWLIGIAILLLILLSITGRS
jgi:late competence protein required for DNA uptake (superfamily II DNA/RNA helicase)